MRKIATITIVVAVFFFGAYYVRSYNNPCLKPLAYGMGTYDARFGITQDQFLKVAQESETEWEEAYGRNLFNFDPEAGFKLNLVFDERQQKTLKERELRQKIDLTEDNYETLVSQFNIFSFQHKQDVAEYDQQKAAYEARLNKYNQDVSYWNKEGGALEDEYDRLSAEKKALTAEATSLERMRIGINQQVRDLNALAERVNSVAKNLNKDVDDYNGHFGTSRQFDQGNYTGNEINIFQFNEESDLRLVMAHEFGHALNLDHVEDPVAIMYYLMDAQDLNSVTLAQADLDALSKRCSAESLFKF